MSAKDYYAILGVDKKSTEAQIKSAFRKLAKKYHPDVNPNDKSSENRFKEINEAYEVLSDKKKRAQYDQLRDAEAHGFTGFSPGGAQPGSGGFSAEDFSHFDFGNLGDMFSSIFGGRGFGTGSSGFGPQRGEDLHFEVEIPFERAVHGGTTILSVPKQSICSTCHGSGAQPGTSVQTCPQCKGRGTVQFSQGGFAVSRPCPRCAGRGHIITTPCYECNGSGQVNKIRKLRIKIPEGVDNGTKIRIPGEGQAGNNGAPPGDLYVTFRIQHHETFDRKGKDIYIEVPISITQALLGGEIEVPTLNGKVRMKIPAGTQPGTLLRLKGQGISQRQGLGKGDQFVKIKVVIPKHLTESQRKLIEELEKSLSH